MRVPSAASDAEETESGVGDALEEAPAAPPSVSIGVPGGADGLEFAPLMPGGELRLEGSAKEERTCSWEFAALVLATGPTSRSQ